MAGCVARFELNGHLLRHCAAIILFKSVAGEIGKFHPEIFAQKIVAASVEQFFRLSIDEGEFPVPVHGEKSIARLFQDVGHSPDCFLQLSPHLIALDQCPNAPFGHRESHMQSIRIDRLSQIIVRAGFERLFQVFGVITRGHEKNEKFVTVWLSAKFAAQIDAALARQHPIQNQKWK